MKSLRPRCRVQRNRKDLELPEAGTENRRKRKRKEQEEYEEVNGIAHAGHGGWIALANGLLEA